jgi:hypothetical protein
MSEFKYDKDLLLEKTNGGLDVIRLLYPECEKGNNFVHFKLRNEDTASTIVYKSGDLYKIKDFGDSQHPLNAIDAVMHKEGVSFPDACKWIAQEFSINGNNVAFAKADFEMKKATKKQKPGDCFFEFKDFTPKELEVLGPLVTVEICKKFNLKSCASITRIKTYDNHPKFGNDPVQVIVKSNERYPILVYDFGTWQKIYQPFSKKDPKDKNSKDFRFSHAGKKADDYIFGLENLIESYNEFVADYDGDEKEPKLDLVIIGGGDRDGLNVASLDYPVVWLNSETATLDYALFKELKEYAHDVYYMGDIDPTGKSVSIEKALKFIDLKIVWLPEWLTESFYNDKPRKDFTDFMKLTWKQNKSPEQLQVAVKGLLSVALPARFWDYSIANAKKGKQPYSFNNEACYRFLSYNGYYRFEEDTAKEDFSFIHVKKGIVNRVKHHHLSNFPGEYLKKKKKPIALLNFVHKTTQLSEKSLAKIELKKLNFKDCSYGHQYMFFQNKIWKITKDAITEHPYGDIKDTYTWQDKIIPHQVKINKIKENEVEVSQPAFKITHDGERFDIEILKTDNHFLNYLINTSRTHWRKCGDAPFKLRKNALDTNSPAAYKTAVATIEKEKKEYREKNKFNIAEEDLTWEEIQEQKEHLINKIFAYGYLLHKQKIDDRAWCVFAMDNRISDVSDSNGGSGKSVMFNVAVRQILLNNSYKAGRDPEIFKNKFLYEGVDGNTDFVIFDDIDGHFPITKLFSEITGDLPVNPKHGKQYVLPFSESPKFAITSNFGLFKVDSSTSRRILYTVFSDYYHYKSDDDEMEYKPSMDFGKMLFSQFDEGEWNDFFNLSAEAVQFYLQQNIKINPPMDNVDKRNNLTTMGDGFKEWADTYFTDSYLNDLVPKNEAFIDFEQKSKLKGWTAQRFKKSIKEWCKYYGYFLNPPETLNTQGKCKHNYNGTTIEMVYIKTSKIEQLQGKINKPTENDVDPTDDLPF